MKLKWLVSNGLVSLYRKIISPIIHTVCGPAFGCRFEPTCSEYFGDAIETFGIVKGGGLGLRRICRCHPWGGSGFDPIPTTALE
jgi:uncharacterized protein